MIEIKNKADCCGCTACKSICGKNAISLQYDDEGFLYPFIDRAKCTDCNRCIEVCPQINKKETYEARFILALRSNDDNVLFKSSSGGFFFTVASFVLENQGYVVGASYGEGLIVRHVIIDKKCNLSKLLGSKYVQSNMGDIFYSIKRKLKTGKLLLFTGTPCQVAGLLKFLGRDYDNLITIDVLCHAVPSPLIFQDYLNYAGKCGIKNIKTINMRNKKYIGWNPAISWGIKFKSGRYSVDDSRIINWSRLFFSELISRPSCHSCQYATIKRVGDFSMGDYWDRQHHHDELYNKKGTSLVFINNIKAQNLFNKIKSQISFWEISEEDSLQPCLCQPTPPNPNREEFWNFYRTQGFEYCYNHYFKQQFRPKKQSFVKNTIKDLLIKGPWKFPEDLNESFLMRLIRKIR